MNDSIEKAIKLSVQGGYKATTTWKHVFTGILEERANAQSVIFLDPLFWSCLGKALGEIDDRWPNGEMRCENKLGRCEARYCEYGGYKDPYEKWHHFIDHLASGQSPSTFFQDLLDKKS
jgi:hypothetical protein